MKLVRRVNECFDYLIFMIKIKKTEKTGRGKRTDDWKQWLSYLGKFQWRPVSGFTSFQKKIFQKQKKYELFVCLWLFYQLKQQIKISEQNPLQNRSRVSFITFCSQKYRPINRLYWDCSSSITINFFFLFMIKSWPVLFLVWNKQKFCEFFSRFIFRLCFDFLLHCS